ncbi:MAG TPA: hypothetical protein VMT52_08575 [Planctomycetota bacterium]|nr:hypothetical protein [Planctomycetota bacterium]
MLKKQPILAFALLVHFHAAHDVRAQDVAALTAALVPARPAAAPRPQLETERSPRRQWDTTHAQLHYLPPEYTSDPSLLRATTVLPWAFVERSLDKWSVLGESPYPVPTSLYPVNQPEDPEFVFKLRKLIHVKFHRELRRGLRSELKSLYRDDLSMRREVYEGRVFQVNNLGRLPTNREAPEDLDAEYTARELKQEFFGERRHQGESSTPLFAWGALSVSDTGSLKCDMGTVARSLFGEETDEEREEREEVTIGEERQECLFKSRQLRLRTNFRFDVDPFRSGVGSEPLTVVRRCGLAFEVEWRSDILGRERASTELEIETDLDGEYKAFINFVVKSW